MPTPLWIRRTAADVAARKDGHVRDYILLGKDFDPFRKILLNLLWKIPLEDHLISEMEVVHRCSQIFVLLKLKKHY